jgi:SAM-dependent methyltransferase
VAAQLRSSWEQRQAEHYDRIAVSYEQHYSDECSQRYRSRFMNASMLGGIDLDGVTVLEAMCGSGQTTGDLLARGARITGLDISPSLVSTFRKTWPGCQALCASILDTGLLDETYDAVVVVGGLHHLHPNVDQAINEIHRLLKPGGYFCLCEPHVGSLPDMFRKLWYRCDRLFEKNEAAIDLDRLLGDHAHQFECIHTTYLGNIAYMLVLNSMVFRVPVRWKRFYTPFLLWLESVIGLLQGKLLSCYAAAQWRKRPLPSVSIPRPNQSL